MRKSLVLLVLPLLAALAGRVEASPTHASPVNSGDRVLGTIDSADDVDLFRIEAPDGATLEVSAKAARKSALLPEVGLIDPAGAPVDLKRVQTGLTTSAVAVPGLGIHETGAWTVSVSGYGGTTGAYQLVVKVAAAPKVRATVTVPAGATVQQHFVGVKDARVDFTVIEREGPGLSGAAVCCPADHVIPGTAAVRSGNRLHARKILLAQGGGLYGVEMTNSSLEPTTVDLTMIVRFPKVRTKKVPLGAEPRPAAVSPTVGCNGTPFVVTGTGFESGARVVFADSDEALAVQWISATEMRGIAPECAASRSGAAVPVSVLNPDGQFGSTPSTFKFIGIPAPTAFTPALSPLEGGVTVHLAGSRFRQGYSVEVGGIPAADVACVSTSHLTFRTPAAAAGCYDVVVVDEYGRPAAALPGLWYSDTPDVTAADPSLVSSAGGIPITLVGTGLVPGARVFVDGTEGTVTSRVPPTSLTFVCPPAHAGAVEVEVRDPLGRSFRGEILTMTRALHDASATALPPAPVGADFRGDHLSLADTTGDGMPEILLTSNSRWVNPLNGQFMPGSFLLVNDGAGAFSDATYSALPAFPLPNDDGQGNASLLGDLDGDGMADAVLVRAAPLPAKDAYFMYKGYKAYYEVPGSSTFDPPTENATRFLLNGGTGVFTDKTDQLAPETESTPAMGLGERWQGNAAALGDLDGDGDGDLLVVSAGEVDHGAVSGFKWTYKYIYYYYYYYRVRDTGIASQEVTPGVAFRVLENDGTGAFYHDSYDDPYPVVSQAGAILDDFRGSAVAVGDLDGDGMPDAVVVAAARTKADNGAGGVKDAPALRVLFNNGDGGFRHSPDSVPAALGESKPASLEWWQGGSVALGDFDGDGDLDIAVGRGVVQVWSDGGQPRVLPALLLFRNDGRGGFTEDTEGFLPAALTTQPTERTILGVTSMASADIDGDGLTDLVITGRTTAPPSPDIPDDARMCTRILLNDGEGGLKDATPDLLAPADVLPADSLCVGDVDGDGLPDVVLVLNGDPGDGKRSLRVLLNR